MADELKIKEVRYFRVIKPPTLKQYLLRRAVSEAMSQVKDIKGTAVDPETKHLAPLSAIKFKQLMQGITADKLAKLHPDWCEDYRREHGDRG